ncbi:MAG: ABC transporter substrate-binding protein [Methanobacterium sp.]
MTLESVEALDNTTVQFRLNDPQSTFIHKLAGLGIVPKYAYNNETYGQNPIGSGPYKFVHWDRGQQVILERNDEYFGQKPYFRRITLLFMEPDAAFVAAKAGEADLAEIPLSHVNQTIEGMKTVALDTLDARGIAFPMHPDTGKKTEDNHTIGNNVTSDIAIRRALNVGIDRQALVDGPLYGQGSEEFTGVDRLPFGNPEAIFEDGNIEEARKILTAGGWEDTDGDGILEKNRTKAEFTLTYPANRRDREALAIAVSEQARKLGIKINVEGKSWDEIDRVMHSTPNVWGWGSIDPTDVYLRFHSARLGGGQWVKYNNVIYYNNSVVDNNLRKAMTTFDQNTSNKYWRAAAWDGTTGYSKRGDAAWLWLVTLDFVYVMDNDLCIGTPGLMPHGGDLFNNIHEWRRINQTS